MLETKTIRELALQWFNEKNANDKSELSHKYYKDTVSYNFTSLTGREIEEIYRKEVGDLKLHQGEIVDESYPKDFQEAYIKENPNLVTSAEQLQDIMDDIFKNDNMNKAHVFQHNTTGVQIFVYHCKTEFEARLKFSNITTDTTDMWVYLGEKIAYNN